jgi:hypothetical protein
MVNMARRAMRGRWAWPLAALGLGCGIAPKHFGALADPAPMVRARAVGLDDQWPETVVVPALIARLNDKDPVVRLSAHERLKRRTGQDFGYVPWADAQERAAAVARWQSWWQGRAAALAQAEPAAKPQPIRRRRTKWPSRGQPGLANSAPMPYSPRP